MILRTIASVLLLTMLLGCGSSEPIPEDHYYALTEMPSVERYSEPVLDHVLVIEQPSTDGLRSSRALVYSKDANHLERKLYFYHHWENRPVVLVQDRLIDLAKKQGLAKAVHANTSEVAIADLRHYYRLKLTLNQFDQHIDGDRVSAVVSLSAKLLNTGPGQTLILEQDYSATSQASSTAMVDTAVAMTESLDRILTEIIADIESSVGG